MIFGQEIARIVEGLVGAMVVLHFIGAYFGFDFKKPKNILIFIGGSLFYLVFARTTFLFVIPRGVEIFGLSRTAGTVIMFLVPDTVPSFLFAAIFLRGSVTKKLFITFLAFVCMAFCHLVTMSLIILLVPNGWEYIDTEIVGTYATILPILLAALLFQFLLRWLKKGGHVFGAAEWRFVTATMVVSTVVCISLMSIGHNFWVAFATDGGDILIFALVLAAINLLCIVMVGSLSKANRIRTENILLKIQNEYRESYAENTQRQYEESQRLRHDMKQSINALAALCGQGKYDRLAEYLAEMSQHIDTAEATVNTSNEIVNAILNTKLSYAKSKGIKTLCRTVNDFAGIEDIDLCNLLGNMLDNAVEACLACPAGEDRYIEVSITADNDSLTVLTKNSFNSEVVKKNPQLQSTKSDEGEAHGFGVRTIKSIAERYQGKVEFYEEKDLFYVCVSLCRVGKHFIP